MPRGLPVEIELIASRAAVVHILGTGDAGFYVAQTRSGSVGRAPSERLVALFKSACEAAGSPPSGDSVLRIEDLSGELAPSFGSPQALWGAVRKRIGVLCSAADAALRLDLTRVVDPLFFSVQPAPKSYAGSETDAHVHAGGAVAWDTVWSWIMTGAYPIARFARRGDGLVTAREFMSLLGRARRLRRGLLAEHGPLMDARAHGSDASLFRRLYLKGDGALNSEDVRNYVLIRCLARRLMIAAEVEDLDDYTRRAWRRWWGQRPAIVRRVGGTALLVRLRRVEVRKAESAIGLLVEDCGVNRFCLRVGDDEQNIQELVALQRLAERERRQRPQLELGLVVHARRPKAPDSRRDGRQPTGEDWRGKWLDTRERWERTVRRMRSAMRRDVLRASDWGFDAAGPERNWRASDVRAVMAEAPGPVRIHAGEDFYDPWQGLAAVLNAVRSTTRGVAPRIGHASILGVDPFRLRWGAYRTLGWARAEGMIEAWLGGLLDGAQLVGELMGALENPFTLLHITPGRVERDLFFRAQRIMADQAIERGTIVETLPSSNVMVLRASGFEWAPAWGLCALRHSRNRRRLVVTVGTDNPGFMGTTIEDEYARLASAYDRRQELEHRGLAHVDHLHIGPLPWVEIEARLRRETREQEAAWLGNSRGAPVR